MPVINVELRDRGYPVHVGPGVREPSWWPDPYGRQTGCRCHPGVDSLDSRSRPQATDNHRSRRRISEVNERRRGHLSEDDGRPGSLAPMWWWQLVAASSPTLAGSQQRFITAVFASSTWQPRCWLRLMPLSEEKQESTLVEGKNLVGAFWQPSAVICDTEMLTTLPIREYRSGLGEVAKYHFLGPVPTVPTGSPEVKVDAEIVAACVQIKADVVAADEREGGRRAILNYGHTLAHAIETAGQYDLRHGEAVAIGIAYAAAVARTP